MNYIKYKSNLGVFFLCACALVVSLSKLQADVVVSSNNADYTIAEIKAGHFLTQASMGPTIYEIRYLARRIQAIGDTAAFNEWIDSQFRKSNESALDLAYEMIDIDGFATRSSGLSVNAENRGTGMYTHEYRRYAWWHQAVYGKDQLRQRMSWAMYQIFVAHTDNALNGWEASSKYYDMLKENAFGNYRDLLETITYNPIMGTFLGHLKNDKGDEENGIYPDENYAREVMQLFSVGVYDTNSQGRPTYSNGQRIENYTNDDVLNLAKVFTGLSYEPTNGNTTFYNASDSNGVMYMYDDHHDVSEKTVLGKKIPAGQTGDEDISQALDILFNHDTTPQFIAQRLIQRFTCSTPHPTYISAVRNVFADNGSGVRGDFKEVLRAILMHPHARNILEITKTNLTNGDVLISVSTNPNLIQSELQGRLREPVLQLAQYLRYFQVDSKENEESGFGGYFKPAFLRRINGQDIGAEISVFNYYSADYLPTSGPAANKNRGGQPYALPEFQTLPNTGILFTEGMYGVNRREEIEQRATISTVNAPLNRLVDYSDYDQTKSSFSWLVNEFNLYMCYGTMEQELTDELIEALDGLTDNNQTDRFANAMALLLSSADYAVSH